MRRFIFQLFIGLSLLLPFVGTLNAQEKDKYYLFYGKGCPHCAAVEKYFSENGIYEKYLLESKEIYFNDENAILFGQFIDEHGADKDKIGVPALVTKDKIIVGDIPIIQFFEDMKKGESEELPQDVKEKGIKKSNLTIFAVVAGAVVDAINPCAFAVLIILMTTILASGNPRKALKSGLAFSSSIFISYFLMGVGLYSVISSGNVTLTIYRLVGVLAIILGVLNLKDWLWYGKGFIMEVPMSWRPKLKQIIGSVTNPVGAFAIGFLVSLFLLPCTSGPYIVILGLLAKNPLDLTAIFYLLIYNLIFIAPMILISYFVYKGFDPKKAEEIRQKNLKRLHLIAGIVMILIGVVILRGWI
jgi:cytochrome c biogenesis protein CcdA